MAIDWVKMEEMGNICFKNILYIFHSQSRGAVFISRLVVPLEPTNDQRLLIWNCENWYPNWNHTIYGGTLDFFLCWKCSNLLFRNRCEQSWRGGIWNTRGKLRARSHFLASNFLVIILTMTLTLTFCRQSSCLRLFSTLPRPWWIVLAPHLLL